MKKPIWIRIQTESAVYETSVRNKAAVRGTWMTNIPLQMKPETRRAPVFLIDLFFSSSRLVAVCPRDLLLFVCFDV